MAKVGEFKVGDGTKVEQDKLEHELLISSTTRARHPDVALRHELLARLHDQPWPRERDLPRRRGHYHVHLG